MLQVFLYLCGTGMVVILLLALRDTWRWRQGKSLIERGQLLSRWASAVILVALTVLMLVGFMQKDVRRFALGWLAILILITLLMFIALLDLYQVAKTQRTRRRELLKDFRRKMEDTFRQGQPPESNGKAGKGEMREG